MTAITSWCGWRCASTERRLRSAWGGESTCARGAGISTRLMVTLHYLKYQKDLGDEDAVEHWLEKPSWQYFSGARYFQHCAPADASSMTRWRQRLGGAEAEPGAAGRARRSQRGSRWSQFRPSKEAKLTKPDGAQRLRDTYCDAISAMLSAAAMNSPRQTRGSFWARFSAGPAGRQGPISAHPGSSRPGDFMRENSKNDYFRID